MHEFGHFAARRRGASAERFPSVLAKRLASYRRYGTEYVIIALILLAATPSKMLDERAEPVASELRRHAFNNKTVGQRAAIIAAGPVANFIFAIFAYWLSLSSASPAFVRSLVK